MKERNGDAIRDVCGTVLRENAPPLAAGGITFDTEMKVVHRQEVKSQGLLQCM
jgi:hypothetical protein